MLLAQIACNWAIWSQQCFYITSTSRHGITESTTRQSRTAPRCTPVATYQLPLHKIKSWSTRHHECNGCSSQPILVFSPATKPANLWQYVHTNGRIHHLDQPARTAIARSGISIAAARNGLVAQWGPAWTRHWVQNDLFLPPIPGGNESHHRQRKVFWLPKFAAVGRFGQFQKIGH